MRVNELVLTLLLCGRCIAGSASPATCDARTIAKSGTVSATVVELYTSEGCDSCPPADKWFSTLGYPREGVVPLAFHVDYWDYIGWKDRFARPAYAQRQRDSVARHGSRTTYTPQVMLDGRDLRAWSNPLHFQARLRETAARTPRADLTIETSMSGGGVEVALSATVALPADRADAALYLAVTENNLTSRVTAGENKGVLLRHDHVVREMIGPIAVAHKDRAAGHYSASRIVTLPPAWKREELSIVAFMQDARTGEMLQALGTPLCRG